MSQKIKIQEQFPTTSSRISDSVARPKVKIQTWKFGMKPALFYVQAKGNHAGRPLTSATANCWAVFSEVPHLRTIAFSIYKSQQLKPLIIGTCIPFMRLSDYRPILEKAALNSQAYNPDNLRTIELLEAHTASLAKQIQLLRDYQTALAYKINHTLNIIES